MGLLNSSQTQTSQNQTTAPTAFAGQQYTSAINQAAGLSQTPYNPATNTQIAGLTQPQYTAFNQLQGIQGTQQPYLSSATNYANMGAAPISSQAIQGYLNPYQQQVTDATMAQLANQQGQQSANLTGSLAASGALGGDRSAVAQGILANQQSLASGQTLAGLNNQNYSQALSAAQQDAARQSQAAYTMGNLGQEAVGLGIQGAQAGLSAGNQLQAQQQAQNNAGTQNAVQQTMWPYQNTQYLAQIAGALGPLLGGTSTGQSSSQTQNPLGTAVGLGTLGYGLLFSDERLKQGIQPIGKTFDGQTIYKFHYKGDRTPRMGLIAQEVEKKHPEAVATVNGFKAINVDTATKDAERKRRAAGGAVRGYDSGGGVQPFDSSYHLMPFPVFGGGNGGGAAHAFPQLQGQNQAQGQSGDPFASAGQMLKLGQSIGGQGGLVGSAGGALGNAIFGSGGFSYADGGAIRGFDSGGTVNLYDETPPSYHLLPFPTMQSAANAASAFPSLQGQGQGQGTQSGNPFGSADQMLKLGQSIGGTGGLIGSLGSLFAGGGAVRGYAEGGAPEIVDPEGQAQAGIQPFLASAAGLGGTGIAPAPQTAGPETYLGMNNPNRTPAPEAATSPMYVPNASATAALPSIPSQGASAAQAPATSGAATPAFQDNGFTNRLETGKSDPMAGLGSRSHDTSNSYSYGNYGLNTLPGASAWQFRDEEGKRLGITADPGTPEFDRQWMTVASSNPQALRSAELSWYNKHVAARVGDLKEAGVPPEVAQDPRVAKYFQDRVVQMGPNSIRNNRGEIGKAWQASGGDAQAFLHNVSSSDLQHYRQYFPHASAQGIYSEEAHRNRVMGREAYSLGESQPSTAADAASGAVAGLGPLSPLSPAVHGIMQRLGYGDTTQPDRQGGILAKLFGSNGLTNDPLGIQGNPLVMAGLGALAPGTQKGLSMPFELQQQQRQHAMEALKFAQEAQHQNIAQAETGRHNLAAEATAARMASQKTLQRIGTDAYGQPEYGFIDPESKTVTRVQMPQSGGEDPNLRLTGNDYLKTVDPNRASMIKKLTNYEIQIPGGAALRSPYWQRLFEDAVRYDPNFDATNYKVRQDTKSDFSSKGKSGQNITLMDTAIDHLGKLYNKIDDLGMAHEGDYGWGTSTVNAFNRWKMEHRGDPKLTAFEANKHDALQMLIRAAKGGIATIPEVEAWNKTVNAADTPEALKAAVGTGIDLIEGRLQAVGDSYNRSMNVAKNHMEWLSPTSQKYVDKIKGDRTAAVAGTQQGAGGIPPRPANVPAGAGYSPSTGLWYDPQTGRPIQ
jgi:Chaperone of endosialidase